MNAVARKTDTSDAAIEAWIKRAFNQWINERRAARRP